MFLRLALASLIVLAPSAAFAGTVVTNSTNTRFAVGSGTVSSYNTRTASGSQDNFSQSVKAESYAPNATASVNLYNGQLSGSAWGSTNPINPDPVAIITNSSQREYLTFTENSGSVGLDKYTFTETGYSHQVSSDSF